MTIKQTCVDMTSRRNKLAVKHKLTKSEQIGWLPVIKDTMNVKNE